jgi:hypothetical protein
MAVALSSPTSTVTTNGGVSRPMPSPAIASGPEVAATRMVPRPPGTTRSVRSSLVRARVAKPRPAGRSFPDARRADHRLRCMSESDTTTDSFMGSTPSVDTPTWSTARTRTRS